MPRLPDNVSKHVQIKKGWFDIFENEEKAIERATKELNKRGYRVVAVYPDGDFAGIEKVKVKTLTAFSFGFYRRKPGMVIVAEKVAK
jgi:hypothetical protein